jgi:NADH:ubiquinone reductase (non-electrogenic)
MLVWATGNKSVPLIDEIPARKSSKGLRRLITDSRLRVYKPPSSPTSSTESLAEDEIYEGVYALGDAADVYNTPLPTTAEVAVQKAKYLSRALNSGDETTKFSYAQKALVSYIGGHDGVIGGRDWTGRSAWLAWRSGSLMWTRSVRGKVMILLTWMINAVVGKEIARM